jgi:hypothetical protein
MLAKCLLCSLMWLFVISGAQAQDVGTGIVCDQQAQLETYYGLTGHGISQPEAIKTVNIEAKGNACVLAMVIYHRGNTVTTIQSPNGRIDIVEILVVTVFLGTWVPVHPIIQYTGFYAGDEPA